MARKPRPPRVTVHPWHAAAPELEPGQTAFIVSGLDMTMDEEREMARLIEQFLNDGGRRP